MPDKNLQNDHLACEQWEAMLAEALDGPLAVEDAARFDAHATSCAACAQLLEESRRGQQWLRYLAAERAVPEDLVAKILALSRGQVLTPAAAPASTVIAMPKQPAWKGAIPWYAGLRRRMEPRLMMTAAMAFFSIALTLNLTGVHNGTMRWSDLNPANLRSNFQRQLATASSSVTRYYDHLRFVYEVEARVREFRRTEEQEDSGQRKNEQHQQGNHGGSANKSGTPSKDGSLNEPPAERPAPVVASHMIEAKLEWKNAEEEIDRDPRDLFEGRHIDQAGRSLA
jgi:hypothetical protein